MGCILHLTGWGVYFMARVSPKALGRWHLTPGPTVFVIRFDPIRCMGTIHITGWGVYFMARVSPKVLGRRHLTPGPTAPNTWADVSRHGSLARSDYLVTFLFVRFDPIRCMGTIHLIGWGVHFMARVSPKALDRRHLTPGPTVLLVDSIRFDAWSEIHLTGWVCISWRE